eukprot:9370221-Alexandrium_andersonii.AAC.1
MLRVRPPPGVRGRTARDAARARARCPWARGLRGRGPGSRRCPPGSPRQSGGRSASSRSSARRCSRARPPSCPGLCDDGLPL